MPTPDTSITGFLTEIVVGDSYTTTNGREIQIPVRDTNGNPITGCGSRLFSDASITFRISRSGETDPDKIITGTATYVDPAGTGTSIALGAPYFQIELPASETAKGILKYKYSGVLTCTWTGTGTDVVSFETEEITFDN